jgi:hypothetical protein
MLIYTPKSTQGKLTKYMQSPTKHVKTIDKSRESTICVMITTTNPRQMRAFAQAARARANADPTPEAIQTVIRYDAAIMRGPRKSREMGVSNVLRLLDATHRVHVDWTVMDDEGKGNFGGKVIPVELERKLIAENSTRGKEGPYDAWVEAITTGESWVGGSEVPAAVRFQDTILPSEAINSCFSTHTFDLNGAPRKIEMPRQSLLVALLNTAQTLV